MRMLCGTCVFSRWRSVAIAFSCLLWVAGSAFAQAGSGHTLSGTVYGGGNPLPGTTVDALNAGTTTVAASTTTDSSGHYSLMLTDGQYSLHVTPPAGSGFTDATSAVTINGADQLFDVVLLAPQGGGKVSGVVRGLGSNPLPNVNVYAYASSSNQFLAWTTTDNAGAYSLTAASTNIYMQLSTWNASPYAPNNWNATRYGIVVSATTTQDFNIPIARVSGMVKGKDGASLANASISAWGYPYDQATNTYYNDSTYGTSGADGSYSLVLISGSANFNVSPPNTNYWSLSDSLSFSGDTTHDFVLDLRRNSTVGGTVRGRGGNPLPNVNVYAYSSTTNQFLGYATTGANGAYSLSAASGTIYMQFSTWSSSPYAPNNWNATRYGIDATSATTTVDLNLPVAQISGVVKGKDGATLGSASVSGWGYPYDQATNTYYNDSTYSTSAADGSYSILLISGNANFNVSPPNSNYWQLTDSLSFSGDISHDFVLDVRQNSTVSGTVRGLGNNPLPNVNVYAYSSTTNQFLGYATTDQNGSYSLSAANGTIYMQFSTWNSSPYAPSNWNATRYGITVSGPATIDLNLPIATVNGISTDSNGAGVSNVSISAWGYPYDQATSTYYNESTYATTGSDGTYTLQLIKGSLQFNITPPNQSGFTQASLNGVNLTGNLNQRIILQHPDLVPPQIVAGPVVVHLSATSVSVSWTTNEASTSRVEYGIGSMSSISNDVALTTNHEVTLQNLALNSLYQFRVGSTDAAGNGPTFSHPDTFTTQSVADATPPVITSGPTVASIDQTSAIIQWTTDEPATTNVGYGTTTALGTAVNGSATRFTVEHSVRLTGLTAQTTYYAQVSSADPDGNKTLSSVFSFTTLAVPDTTAPVITGGPIVSAHTDTKLTITWTTDEPSTSGVSFNDGTHYDLVNDSTLTTDHQITISGLTPSTTYNIRVSSTDAVGNGPTISKTITGTTDATPDTTAPIIANVTVSSITTSSAVISWTTNEMSNSSIRYGVTSGATSNSQADVSSVTSHQLTVTGLQENTTYFFTVASTDGSGNTATAPESTFTTATNRVDQPPTAPGPLTVPHLTNASSITITWGASTDDVGIAKYEVLRNTVVVATLSPNATSFIDSGIAEGSFTYQIRVTDTAGHAVSSDSASVIVDRTAPVISAQDVSAEATGPQTVVSYSVSAHDNVDATVTATCVAASGSQFPVGTTPVVCTATDAAGNAGSASFNVIVKDTTPPSINAPSTVTKEATASNGATVTFTASATDLVDGPLTASCSPAPGTVFPVGNTDVTCSATDAAGNVGKRTITVKVVDTTPPVLTLPRNMLLEATGPRGAAAAFAASATDIVTASPAILCVPPSGSTFALGVSNVLCTATDAAGNSSSGSFSISVVDTTPPVVTVPKDITAEAANKNGASVPFVTTAADVVSGSITPACTPASGSIFALGTTAVTCTATDAAKNTGKASFNVIVKDTTPPTIASVTPSQAVLWPPDHKMVSMTVAVSVTDAVDAAPVCKVSSIVSNEVINGLGDGDTAPDWVIGTGLNFQLRAERAMKGSGRVYTIKVECSDFSGNKSFKSATVSVPANQK